MSECSEIISFFIKETVKLDILSVLEVLGENVATSFSSFYSRAYFTKGHALLIKSHNTLEYQSPKNLNCKFFCMTNAFNLKYL